MMFHGQGFSRNRCNVVAVVSGELCGNNNQKDGAPHQPKYPFPDLSSSGRLKVKDFKAFFFFLILLNDLLDCWLKVGTFSKFGQC